jgi:hypothetical protein
VEIGAYDLVVLPEDMVTSGPGTPPPLPASTRPDPMPVVQVPSGLGSRRGAGGGPLDPQASGRVPSGGSMLLRVGVAALGSGLLLGFALRRLLP